MGMFDSPKLFSDNFNENDHFTLEDAKIGNEIDTSYGKGRPALLKINGEWFSIFGEGINSQIEQMDSGDLPQLVTIARIQTKTADRQVKRIVPIVNGQPVLP